MSIQTVDQTASLTLAERLGRLLDHLGITRTHLFVHVFEAGWEEIVAALDERIAGFGFVTERPGTPPPVLRARSVGVTGANNAAVVAGLERELAAEQLVLLPAYTLMLWSDLVADRPSALLEALRRVASRGGATTPAALTWTGASTGEVAALRYELGGSGPPVLLLPLCIARSQWTPLLPQLQQEFTTVVVSGPCVAPISTFEARARDGYRLVITSLFDELQVQDGEQVLEVGCGTGALVRRLATMTPPTVRITAADVSPFMLREARLLAAAEQLDGRITFEEADALALPFADESFDVTFSATMLEEGDADRMLAELLRLTRPGGRVGVVVRAVDLPPWLNLELPLALRTKVSTPGGAGVTPDGCADASLYARFVRAGLQQVRMFPQLGGDQRETPRSVLARGAHLDADERRQLQAAVDTAVRAGTFFVARPYHVAVGTKPA